MMLCYIFYSNHSGKYIEEVQGNQQQHSKRATDTCTPLCCLQYTWRPHVEHGITSSKQHTNTQTDSQTHTHINKQTNSTVGFTPANTTVSSQSSAKTAYTFSNTSQESLLLHNESFNSTLQTPNINGLRILTKTEIEAKIAILPQTHSQTNHQKDCQRLRFSSKKLPVTALASFPGSGNTWVRHLIQQATGENIMMCPRG